MSLESSLILPCYKHTVRSVDLWLVRGMRLFILQTKPPFAEQM